MSAMIHVIKLTPKPNSKGGMVLSNALYPAQWIVKDQKEELSWSPREGPWLYITPDNHVQGQERWVSLTDDNEFFVEIIR